MPRRTARQDLPRPLDTVAQSIIACERCPRLRTYCARIGEEKRAAYRDDTYWARPVPGFGDPAARIVDDPRWRSWQRARGLPV